MITNNIIPSDQEKAEIRRRQIATLKASNQMLKEAEEKALSKTTDSIRQSEIKRQFSQAMEENIMAAKNLLHADINELENASYREVDQIYIDKYNRRLETKGLTDEEIHRKETATFSTTKGSKGKSKEINRRQRKGAKKDLGEEYVKLDNEEEIMKQSLVTDDKQIERQRRKNEEIETEIRRKRNNKFNNLSEQIKENSLNNKVQSINNENIGRVTVDTRKEDILSKNVIAKTEENIKNAEVKEKKITKKKTEVIKYDFDFGDIPSYVQYDVIPLPSKGQCYPKNSPLRCGRIPVAYLTAADENIISSPNAYRDGKLFDIILGRKILDKRIKASDLCSGDRDAIILWLRATSYGEDFPIITTHPDTGKQYSIVIKLSQFDYNEFELEGDDNGLFDYETNNGDKIKFKFFTADDEEFLRKELTSQVTDSNKINALKSLNTLTNALNNIDFEEEDKKMLGEDIEEIREIIGTDIDNNANEDTYPNIVTEQMVLHTVSINDNKDREFIRNYVENMRTKTALDYRNYFVNNRPGVDFRFDVNIPESDGGGSFSTFLRIDDAIFINI